MLITRRAVVYLSDYPIYYSQELFDFAGIFRSISRNMIGLNAGVRFNMPSLRLAARRTFAPIWSARRHPIYRLIELADEEQRLRLRPEIDKLIQERIVTSRSKLSDQHQGHDAILEEINKTLKSLVPSIPSQRHWDIAARNYTKFLKYII